MPGSRRFAHLPLPAGWKAGPWPGTEFPAIGGFHTAVCGRAILANRAILFRSWLLRLASFSLGRPLLLSSVKVKLCLDESPVNEEIGQKRWKRLIMHRGRFKWFKTVAEIVIGASEVRRCAF
jgi:hypothetical protein